MTQTKIPTLPPITLLLWEYQLVLLIRALRDYTPANEDEADHCNMLLEIFETIAMQD